MEHKHKGNLLLDAVYYRKRRKYRRKYKKKLLNCTYYGNKHLIFNIELCHIEKLIQRGICSLG